MKHGRNCVMAALFLALIAGGCSSDSVTQPAENADLSGTWAFSWTNMNAFFQGAAVTCSADSVDFMISQTGNTFSGVQQGAAQLNCSINGIPGDPQELLDETIESGTVGDSSVTFTLGTIPGPHQGTLTGGSISGTAEWSFDLGGIIVLLEGEFSAQQS